MNLIRRQINKLNKIIQGESNRNRATLQYLESLGFSLPKIRKALIELNGVNVRELADGHVSIPTVYNVIKGNRGNVLAMQLLADRLALEPEELFPESRLN